MSLKTRCFPDKNYKSIYFNGKTMRLALDSTKPIQDLDYPEFYDIKLTDNCYGDCSYCYQNSTKDNEDVDAITILNDFFNSMNENERPFQIACLEKNTLISTPKGMIEIKNLNIGDFVYNEFGKKVRIINITKNKKETIKLIGNKGFEIICTPEHIFIDKNNNQIEASQTLNNELSIGKSKNILDFNRIIDMKKYGNSSSRKPNKRGGSSGMVLTEDKIALMNTMKLANRYVSLNEEIMWLYGLCVAEGFKRGVALHQDEIEYQNKVNSVYRKITGLDLNCTIRYNKISKGITVETFQPKYWESLFFNEMQIGYGAKNKSIKYLNNLPIKLVQSAIEGMFDGDGCYRKKIDKRTNRYNFIASYKTASKTLAYELIDILYRKFNIYANLYIDKNKERFINGRKLPKGIYYNIEICGKNKINKIFKEKFEDLFSEYSLQQETIYSENKESNFIKIKQIQNIGKNEVYDITLEDNSSHLFTISHGVITHNCGGGEPTLHPQFHDIMKLTREFGIAPNYTTNGMFIQNKSNTEKIIKTTKDYCEGVAITCHSHLNEYWQDCATRFIEKGIFTNFHHLISDKESVDDFIRIYDNWKGDIKYFVVLPMINAGRAKDEAFEHEYFFDRVQELIDDKIDISDIAFGANFYPYLKEKPILKLSLYEPEIMSKYLDLTDGNIYKSSFDAEKPIGSIYEKNR